MASKFDSHGIVTSPSPASPDPIDKGPGGLCQPALWSQCALDRRPGRHRPQYRSSGGYGTLKIAGPFSQKTALPDFADSGITEQVTGKAWHEDLDTGVRDIHGRPDGGMQLPGLFFG
jgi:hypothetical protein